MGRINLEYILLSIRERIAHAIDYDERRVLGEILTTFTIIEEASYGTDNKAILMVMAELEYVAREGAMGFGKKVQLPSPEKISSAFVQR